MSVLDELREQMKSNFTPVIEGVPSYWYRDDVLYVLDAFEAAHPGLVDETTHCINCGTPMNDLHGALRCPACAEATP